MDKIDKDRLLKGIVWDYNISSANVEDVLSGKTEKILHYNKYALFKKILESYSWFVIIQLVGIDRIKSLLTDEVIKGLRTRALQKQYEFIQKRLQEIIPVTG
jgi:hypothetical protein